MLLSRIEYNKRKRFPTEIAEPFDKFSEKITLPQETIFIAYTWSGNMRYVKITCEFAQIHFDLYECNPEGQPLKYGYRKGSVHKNEIAERLFEGDWKIYKIPDND